MGGRRVVGCFMLATVGVEGSRFPTLFGSKRWGCAGLDAVWFARVNKKVGRLESSREFFCPRIGAL